MGILKMSGRLYSLSKHQIWPGSRYELVLTRRYRGKEYGRAELFLEGRDPLHLIKAAVRRMAYDIERMIHVEESKSTEFPQAYSSRRCIY